jgi:adenine-specific DNA-methyltransferase
MDALEKFQGLLRELFEFECADLDFGIYRIMNYKRQVIDRYINEDLPNVIEKELSKGTLARQEKLQNEFKEARQKVIENLGEEALDAEGNLAEQYHGTKVGREYIEARERAGHSKSSKVLENDIYNHLYAFLAVITKMVTLFRSVATPKERTPFPTTARKFIFTGPT